MKGGVIMYSAMLLSEASTSISDRIFSGADNFLGLVTKVGDTCVNNEICVLFLTAKQASQYPKTFSNRHSSKCGSKTFCSYQDPNLTF